MSELKRVIIILFLMFIIIGMTGCSNKYPKVNIDTRALESVVEIDIGSKYEYIDYDVITTDSGKDVIAHFKLKKKGD